MKTKLLALIVGLFVSIHTFACMWDNDTYEMEKQEFPEVMELITGQYLRHSPYYHEWRIKDRTEKLKHYPDSVELYDDLAVSYSKLHKNKEAIQLMYQKDSIAGGLYETYANLGTFYLHDGNFEKGLEYIKKAIEINPDAHFGREIYQQKLAEYILLKQENGKTTFPMFKGYSKAAKIEKQNYNFADYILNSISDTIATKPYHELLDSLRKKAVTGILGMMKFGNYNSPYLLEALGDLLFHNEMEESAKHIAAMAYLRAMENADSTAHILYRNKIDMVLFYQIINNFNESQHIEKFNWIESQLKKEIEKGNAFYAQIEADEKKWIEEGKNPEFEFFRKYYNKVDSSLIQKSRPTENLPSEKENYETEGKSKAINILRMIAGVLALALTVFLFVKKRKEKR